MTSAIDNMSVAEVRKYLGETRKRWVSQTLSQPMYITDKLSNGMTIEEFALKFQQGHHQKRHNKGRKYTKNNGDDNVNDSSDDMYDIDSEEMDYESDSPSSSNSSNCSQSEQNNNPPNNNTIQNGNTTTQQNGNTNSEGTKTENTNVENNIQSIGMSPDLVEDRMSPSVLNSCYPTPARLEDTPAQQQSNKRRGRPKKNNNISTSELNDKKEENQGSLMDFCTKSLSKTKKLVAK